MITVINEILVVILILAAILGMKETGLLGKDKAEGKNDTEG